MQKDFLIFLDAIFICRKRNTIYLELSAENLNTKKIQRENNRCVNPQLTIITVKICSYVFSALFDKYICQSSFIKMPSTGDF